MKFQIWRASDGGEWICGKAADCSSPNPLMQLLTEFELDIADFDGNEVFVNRAAQATYQAFIVWCDKTFFDPKKRALEKQASRDEDARRLAAGEVSREQLAKDNGAFAFPREQITLDFSRAKELLKPKRKRKKQS